MLFMLLLWYLRLAEAHDVCYEGITHLIYVPLDIVNGVSPANSSELFPDCFL